MKTRILFLSCLVAACGEIVAQRSVKSPVNEKIFIELVGGPSLVKFLDQPITPALNYRAAGLVVINFKRSYLQAGLEYLTASGKAAAYAFKFSNHLAGMSVTSQLRMPNTPSISFDLGAFYGFTFSQSDNYPAPCVDQPGHPCPDSLAPRPIHNKTDLQLRFGLSARLPGRFSLVVTNALGWPAKESYGYGYYSGYYMLHGSAGYRL